LAGKSLSVLVVRFYFIWGNVHRIAPTAA
jgi:hypothetical protein